MEKIPPGVKAKAGGGQELGGKSFPFWKLDAEGGTQQAQVLKPSACKRFQYIGIVLFD